MASFSRWSFLLLFVELVDLIHSYDGWQKLELENENAKLSLNASIECPLLTSILLR